MFILCSGRVASKPYGIPFADVKVYSLEELCYYIYHNVYNITEDFFQTSLIEWIKDEVDHPLLAKKLDAMLHEDKINIKDVIVTILCSTDYYREEEIRSLVTVLDDIINLPVWAKKKIKADNYLKYGQYGKAAAEYRKLLHGSFAVNLTPEEYGNVLHNQGIAHFYISSFNEAARDFKEAYIRNCDKESLNHYLYILLMEGQQQEFQNEGIAMGLTSTELITLSRKFEREMELVPEGRGSREFVEECKEDLRKAFAL